MNGDIFNEIVEDQIETCRRVLISKGAEYTPGEDRLSNFRSAAAAQGLTMKQALAGMMAKHTISIFDMVWSDEDYPEEMWEEKITDHLNYLLILKAVVAEEPGGTGEQNLTQVASALAASQGMIPSFPDVSPFED